MLFTAAVSAKSHLLRMLKMRNRRQRYRLLKPLVNWCGRCIFCYGVAHAQETVPESWQKLALNRTQLYLVQVSGIRNLQTEPANSDRSILDMCTDASFLSMCHPCYCGAMSWFLLEHRVITNYLQLLLCSKNYYVAVFTATAITTSLLLGTGLTCSECWKLGSLNNSVQLRKLCVFETRLFFIGWLSAVSVRAVMLLMHGHIQGKPGSASFPPWLQTLTIPIPRILMGHAKTPYILFEQSNQVFLSRPGFPETPSSP